MNPLTKPQVRKAHAREYFDMIARTANEKMIPPIPEPAEQIPFAILLRFRNHWGKTAILGIQVRPMPKPTSRPCVR